MCVWRWNHWCKITIAIKDDEEVVSISQSQLKYYEILTLVNLRAASFLLFTATGGLLGIGLALKTYSISEQVRRKDLTKDILIPLIAEFDSQKFQNAKDLLDDYLIPLEESDKKIFGHPIRYT